MVEKAAARAKAAALRDAFTAAGAQPVEAAILQPAETLLDLYGEDIRARAYVTSDPLRGEQMLRPDFTVPVVQMHMANGVEPARYTYAGEVFRQQEDDPDRASEYLQVGYELFTEGRAEADAEVFALFARTLAPLNLQPATGDIGLLVAAVDALETTDRRKAALRRHIWRPRRFRALLDRFAGRSPVPPTRAALIAATPRVEAPLIGARTQAEIDARIAALREDAAAPAISAAQVDLLDALLALSETAPNVLSQLRDIAVDMPPLRPAVDRIAARLDALSAHGVAVEALPFEASFGRTTLEYYDGFVFGFTAPNRPDLPPVATGGRYDALTRVLGGGRQIPAVGGIIRPGVVAELEGGA